MPLHSSLGNRVRLCLEKASSSFVSMVHRDGVRNKIKLQILENHTNNIKQTTQTVARKMFQKLLNSPKPTRNDRINAKHVILTNGLN